MARKRDTPDMRRYLAQYMPDTEITMNTLGAALSYSRATVTRKNADASWDADDIITLAKVYKIDPVDMLADFGHIEKRGTVRDDDETKWEQLLPNCPVEKLSAEVDRRLKVADQTFSLWKSMEIK